MRKGKELTEQEVRQLPIGSWVWIYWCKDNNPSYVRYNGAFCITETQSSEFVINDDGEEVSWSYDGETCRGRAYYYTVRK